MEKFMSGITYALLAAFLFGASTPFAKLLIGGIDPWVLAGILYLGSGLGLILLLIFNYLRTKIAPISPSKIDFQWLMGATLFGGVLGPVFMMTGLSLSTAASSSLLLNLEGVLTSVIAWVVFREHYDKRIVLGMISIFLGGIILSWSSDSTFGVSHGAIFIIAACLCWAIDNNLTRKVSANDAILITTIKSLVAGATNLFLALFLERNIPILLNITYGIILGFFGYGLSIVCFVLALRSIGTSRTGAYFSIAPFAGATLSLFIFNNEFSLQLIVASLLMGLGVWLHITERHDHTHVHESLTHTHDHIHDDHHQHDHFPNDPPGKKHSHSHNHESIIHNHPHFPDIHHRHMH
jgi:drug/metabolite transporter (DMT)-like permease